MQVARLYYEHDLTQQQIAARLNITRQKVSRLLIQGREDGIVKIIINDPTPSDPDLEVALIKTFRLKKVVLTEGAGLDQSGLRHTIGIAASDYLQKILKDDDCIGIGWGRTLFSVVSNLQKNNELRINVVPMIGGAGDMFLSLFISC